MKKLLALGVLSGLAIVAGVTLAVKHENGLQSRLKAAEAAAAEPAFTQSSLPDVVRAAFEKAYPVKSSGPDLIWKTRDGLVMGSDKELVEFLNATHASYNDAVISFLKQGIRSFMRTCYSTENVAGRWSAGYCIDKLHAVRLR